MFSNMGNILVLGEGAKFLEWRTPLQRGVRTLTIIEAVPAVDSVLPGSWLSEGPWIETLLVEGAMDALDFAVLLGLSHRDELVADLFGSQRFLEGVGLLHIGEEDISELDAMVSLDLLNGEGESSYNT